MAPLWKPVVIILVGLVAWQYVVPLEKVVLSSNGDVRGIHGIRAFIQGDRFWRDQNAAARRELQRLQNQPREDAKFEAEIRQMDAKFAREDAEMCAKDASNCLPPKTGADKLRDQADALEEADFKRDLEQMRVQRMAEVRGIITITEKRMR